jgi:hypothetical protein
LGQKILKQNTRASLISRNVMDKAIISLKKVKRKKAMKKTKFTLEDTPLVEASNYLQEAISIEVKPIYVMLRAF